jgi:hypothetical protein
MISPAIIRYGATEEVRLVRFDSFSRYDGGNSTGLVPRRCAVMQRVPEPGVRDGVSIGDNYHRVLPTLTGHSTLPACEPQPSV